MGGGNEKEQQQKTGLIAQAEELRAAEAAGATTTRNVNIRMNGKIPRGVAYARRQKDGKFWK